MGYIKKYFLFIAAALIVIVYFITRFYHLLSLPIFTDEAIYVRWAQIAKNDASWRFISLTDGKQPLFIWFMMIMMKFIHDPLLAGRVVSVFTGFFTLIGLFLLTREVFRNRYTAILSSFFYLIFPFALVYNRMALYDSLVATFAVWSIYVAVLLAKKVRLDIAFILSLVIGGSMLTKTNGFFNLYLLPTTLLIFDWKQKKTLSRRFLLWCGFAVLTAAISYLYYSILRLSPFFHIIDEKNTIFVYPVKEWIHHPFTYFISNLRALWDWFITYLTWPVFVVLLVSFIIDKKFIKEKILLAVWFIIPFLALAFFGNTIYPRFILPMMMTLIPLIAYTLYNVYVILKNKTVAALVIFILLLAPLISDYFILTNFAKAPIAGPDLGQFIRGWPSGVGVKESIDFFNDQSQNQKIFIGTEGTFGLMPYALEMYLVDNPNITLKGYWPINMEMPKEVLTASKHMPTYFVFYQPCPSCVQPGLAPVTWPVRIVKQIQRAEPGSYYTLYQVINR